MFIITLCSCRQLEAHYVYPFLTILKRLIFRQWSADTINLSLELLLLFLPSNEQNMPCLQKQQGPDLLGLSTLSNFSLQHNVDVKWQPRWDSLILYITAPFLYQANSIYVNTIIAAARVENYNVSVSYALHDTDGCAGEQCIRK